MKIFINNRNYLTWPKGMAEQFAEEGHEVVFLDNASTYEPLVDWYDKCDFEIIKLPNLGNMAGWVSGIVLKEKMPFVYTDPDYDLSMLPKDWPEVLVDGFRLHPGHIKYGLSWEEATVPPENPAYLLDNMDENPDGHYPPRWGRKLEGGWINFPCDTSFAVYRPGAPFTISGIRKDRPYTGIHFPWHVTLDPTVHEGKMSVPFDDEVEYYFDHVQNSSCTAPRVAEILAEYKRRKLC